MVRWRDRRRSDNVEDRRGKGVAVGGGLGVLAIAAVVWLLGGDPEAVLQIAEQASPPAASGGAPPADDEAAQFVSAMLASTEDVWRDVFAARGSEYREPRLVLFDDRVRSACGLAGSATGPFYCPPDEHVYLDLGFFRDLARMGGPGDFAAAYVIGHEVGHHVQNLLGTSDRMRALQRRASRAEANALSVRLELQADCYAGLWAARADRARPLLEPGDVEEGLAAAAAIGDDRIQRRGGRDVAPESFTHGSSAQRQRWLRRGLERASLEACDTFDGGV